MVFEHNSLVCFFDRLCDASELWMDGTFKSAPPLFCQVYTIHASVNNQFFPLLVALLPDKQEVTYRRLLVSIYVEATIRNLIFNPAIIHCDFEISVMNAIRTEIGIDPTGCLFHFTQSIYRHVQTSGLQVAYNTDTPPGTKRWLRRLMGLPLIPAIRVTGVYNAIVAQASNLPQAPQLHQYVFDTYIDPNGALFPNTCWCVFGMMNRTTNMCEGFHNALNTALSVKHPSVYRLIETLQDVEASNERMLAQLAMGAPPKRR